MIAAGTPVPCHAVRTAATYVTVAVDSASLLLAAGVPPTVVTEIMGRATPELTLSV